MHEETSDPYSNTHCYYMLSAFEEAQYELCA